ncbi:hypothetical protein [Paenibacillus alkalitolerans]|uniref:hypothetical protein n=1 Tax=Paenibacillus alkalitolerans TaxID=2799335 RepID=UPI0018F735B9|nr:hypothetical protein [Paenibacillus alkalitolerans]
MNELRWAKRLIGAVVLFTLALGSAAAENAAPSAEPAAPDRSLLQQGLTIHEIDKEVARLKQEEKAVQSRIVENEAALSKQQVVMDKKSDAAGKVLRAYYMGNRDHLWLLLIRMDSLNDALAVLDYLNAVVRNDFRVLRSYRAAYEERLRLSAELEKTHERLQTVISDRLVQREHLTALQKDFDRKLAQLTEDEREKQTGQIEQLTADWEIEGLPLFKTYLTEFGKAMNDIADLLTDESKLSLDGTNIFVRLSEEDFNGYLRSKSRLFEEVTFRFEENKLIIFGSHDSKKATIEGRYVLEQEPENLLRFQIAALNYNGFTLPDTTSKALQEQFELTFRPGRLFAGLEASEVKTKVRTLEVKLKFNGFPLALGND